MKKSNFLAGVLSIGLTVSLFAFANAAGSNVNVTSNNFLNDYVYKTPPYTYLPINSRNLNNQVVPATGTTTSIASTVACLPVVNVYNQLGDFGPEVVKLQKFLNQVNGANLNGLGYFGPATLQEVKNFQYTYGVNPTGYQYIKTTQVVNDILCGKVAKVMRKVYITTNTNTSNAPSIKTISVKPLNSTIPNNVNVNKVPNKGKDLVKEYAPKTIPTLTGNINDAKLMASNTAAVKTSFWSNLQKDFDKIKENYKAYLLVFALVLALFWFLRKAATE